MIHAYDKVYLECAQTALARLFDFAVCERNNELSAFFKQFLETGMAERFGSGDYRLLAGKSGVEIYYDIKDCAGQQEERVKPVYARERSREYWTGWALAYYQWYSGLPFRKIERSVPIGQIRDMYMPYHEMDIRQFCDAMDERIFENKKKTRLKAYRRLAGISQKQLADLSEVPLRMLQEYEQGRKSISKAQAEYLVRISSVLGCRVEDLIDVS